MQTHMYGVGNNAIREYRDGDIEITSDGPKTFVALVFISRSYGRASDNIIRNRFHLNQRKRKTITKQIQWI